MIVGFRMIVATYLISQESILAPIRLFANLQAATTPCACPRSLIKLGSACPSSVRLLPFPPSLQPQTQITLSPLRLCLYNADSLAYSNLHTLYARLQISAKQPTLHTPLPDYGCSPPPRSTKCHRVHHSTHLLHHSVVHLGGHALLDSLEQLRLQTPELCRLLRLRFLGRCRLFVAPRLQLHLQTLELRRLLRVPDLLFVPAPLHLRRELNPQCV